MRPTLALAAMLSLFPRAASVAAPDDAAEIRRRLALLPQIEKRRRGDLKGMEDLSERLKTELSWSEAAEKSLPGLDLKNVKETIPRIPGPPKTDLAARKAYWEKRRDVFKKYADDLARMLDPDDKKTVTDEFDDVYPESLPRLRDEQQKLLDQAQAEARELAERIDNGVKPLDRDLHLGLPMLSGLTVAKLLEALKNYRAAIKAAKLPNDGSDAVTQAAAMLPRVSADAAVIHDAALRWAAADALVSSVDGDLRNLSRVQAGFGDLARLADETVSDAKADQEFVDGSSGELYAPAKERKLALVKKMSTTWKNARMLLENGLMTYQKRRIEEASRDGRLARHYEAKLELATSLTEAK